MSFLTTVEADLGAAETIAVSAVKNIIGYIENVAVIDLEPALVKLFQDAIAALGQSAVATLLGNAIPPATTIPSPDTTVVS